jgi:hypothetical protein
MTSTAPHDSRRIPSQQTGTDSRQNNDTILDRVDTEIGRRIDDHSGQTPKRRQDSIGPYAAAAPGSIVDGYQLIGVVWHRIDTPHEIDVEALRGTHPALRDITAGDAVRLWRDSIGELLVAE